MEFPSLYGDQKATLSGLVSHNASGRSSQKHGNNKRPKEKGIHHRKRSSPIFATADLGRVAELRALAVLEAQLGGPPRDDGPMVGVEFDGLPLGAFTTPFHTYGTVPTTVYGYENRLEKQDIANQQSVTEQLHGLGSGHLRESSGYVKAGSEPTQRVVQEYTFIPEKTPGKPTSSHPGDGPYACSTRCYHNNVSQAPSLMGSFAHTSDSTSIGATSLEKFNTFGNNIFPPMNGGNICSLLGNSGLNFDGIHHDVYSAFNYENQLTAKPVSFQLLSGGISYVGSQDLGLLHEPDQARLDMNRKNDEARIAKEVEAHEKRIRREIERQDIARKKRSEQLRKEQDKQRKEAERVLRDRQREEDRVLREHQRELERREKFLEKESRRVERQRQKDEYRRQKEVARLKVASERAIAKKLAREFADLIDDERLELLEAAAVARGLPCISYLDEEMLNKLDKCKELLKKFPPTSVKMRKPFASKPWIDSNANLGDLLMAWRFLTAFADILKIWSFTLDELVQAFHDYDSRLLGEVHIALMRTLVKDIKDVAEASSSGLTSNQCSLGSFSGGHPHLVEAAFAWGFNIADWQQHLNPQTWPEVLRQFGLAAGYGPRWKKHSTESNRPCDLEGAGENVVNSLRSGLAVASAVSQMQGKGPWRKKRMRLTPGTVKFAAFHVLSVEGDNGLSILDLVDCIQKSGLRDLSTTKTPEASIAAALSRDVKLFERVAPSTYCVRLAYRKNPEDAERILDAARERVHIFQNQSTEGDDPEREPDFADGGDKDDDSDEDVEDIEGDDVGILSEVEANLDEKVSRITISVAGQAIEEKACEAVASTLGDKASYNMEGIISGQGRLVCEINLNDDNTLEDKISEEMDESHISESWIQGLTERDYCNLSVEERLRALVALIDVVNEGNTIRTALEERLEASNTLKKQMWEEFQLDKRRNKEEQLIKLPCPLDDGGKVESSKYIAHESPHCGDELVTDNVGCERHIGMAGFPIGPESSLAFQPGCYTDKSRSHLKADINLKAEQLYAYRSLPLGLDRRRNRYWHFSCGHENDPHSGRIYLESAEDTAWHVIDTEEGFDALLASFDTRGIREAHLHHALRKCEGKLKQWMRNCHESSTIMLRPITAAKIQYKPFYSVDEEKMPDIDLGHDDPALSVGSSGRQMEMQTALNQYLDFDTWLWSKSMAEGTRLDAVKFGTKWRPVLLRSCNTCHELLWPQERLCPMCQTTIDTETLYFQGKPNCRMEYRDFCGQFPSKMGLLKVEILAIEVAIPGEALKSGWMDSERHNWAANLKQSSSPGDLLQVIVELEAAVERDWLSPSYETTAELLNHISNREHSMYPILNRACSLPWIPRTTASVALRLMALDAALFYTKEQKVSKCKVAGNRDLEEVAIEVLPSSNVKEDESEEESGLYEDNENPSSDDGNGQSRRPRGRGGRLRGRGHPHSSEEKDGPLNDSDNKKRTSWMRGREGATRGRGRGRSSHLMDCTSDAILKVSKGKAKLDGGQAVHKRELAASSDTLKSPRGKVKSSEPEIANEHSAYKENLQSTRGRGVRGRGRGRGRSRGRGHGRGGGRGRGRGRGRNVGRSSGRGCSTHVGRSGQTSRRGQHTVWRKSTLHMDDEASMSECEDGSSSQSGGWEDEHMEDEPYHEEDACDEERNLSNASQEKEDGSDLGHGEGDNQDDHEDEDDDHDEPPPIYENDYSDEDDEQMYERRVYNKPRFAEDSGEEDNNEEEMLHGNEDEEAGNEQHFTSSGESE